MNKTKKTLRGPQKIEKKTAVKPNHKLWIIPSAILSVILIIAILFDQLYQRPVLTIDDKTYHLDDLTYYFFNIESYYDVYDQYYQNFGASYWDQSTNDGRTFRELALDNALDTSIYNEVVYKEAVAAGYTLNDEEKEQVANDVTEIIYNSGLSRAQIKRNGFTPEYLTKVMGQVLLAKRYKEDIIKTLGVDTDSIIAEFSKEDYRRYDFEYFYIPTHLLDEQEQQVELDEEGKKEAYNEMKALQDKLKDTEDWTTLVSEDKPELKYYSTHILAKKDIETNTTDFTDELRDFVKAMSNDEISDIFEDDNGYYIIRMIENNSTETYDSAVESAVTNAEEQAFQKEYETNILTKHTFKIHKSGTKKLRMGTVTIH